MVEYSEGLEWLEEIKGMPQLAEFLGVSLSTANRMLRDGKIPPPTQIDKIPAGEIRTWKGEQIQPLREIRTRYPEKEKRGRWKRKKKHKKDVSERMKKFREMKKRENEKNGLFEIVED